MLRTRLILTFSLAVAGCIEPPAIETERQTAPIVGGSEDTGDPAVVNLSITTTAGGFGCTGTLISPRVVLTAAHCLDGSGTTTAVDVYFGSRTIGTDDHFIETIPAEKWTFYSGWSLSHGDIALVLLEYESEVAPIPINRSPLSSYVGQAYRMVGFGNTSPSGGAGVKRTVTSTLEGFQNNYVLQYGSSSANTCQGDSGGPGFMTIGGEQVIAGITSFGTGECLGNSGATHVFQFQDWIDSWVASNDVIEPPTASFVRPDDGAQVGPFFVAEVDATDNTTVEKVELYVDGALSSTMVVPPYIFNVMPSGDGQHTLEARAYDRRGDTGSQTISVTVSSSCDVTGNCPNGFDCVDGECVPEQGGTGELGDSCEANADCISGLCGASSSGSFCTQLCELDAGGCPDGFKCVAAGEGGACVAADDEGGGAGGCAVAPAGGAPAWVWLLALGLLAARRRRSRQ